MQIRNRDSTPNAFNNELIVENANNEQDIPLVNEIFLIDPNTNKVHSVIRQIIPSGDKKIGELAVKQLRDHLENNVNQLPKPLPEGAFLEFPMSNEVGFNSFLKYL